MRDDRHVVVPHRGRLHFPADTLVGMALGDVMASFVNDAFLGLDSDSASLTVSAMPDGAIVQWRTRWR